MYKRTVLLVLFLAFLTNKTTLGFCFKQAGEYYSIDPVLLYTIAKVESDLNPNAVNHNRNGSYDLGLMQINSYWFPILKEIGFDVKDLYSPCINVFIGAWILAQCVYKYGYPLKKAIDCYNKGPSRATGKSSYVKKVMRYYRRFITRRNRILNIWAVNVTLKK